MIHPELPQAIEAERAVLGAILLNRDAITAVAPALAAHMFYYERHGRIYQAMLDLFSKRIPPDARTVSEELRRRELLDACGGVVYLGELIDAAPTSYHAAYYAQFVIDAARLRALIAAGGSIAAVGYRAGIAADAAAAEAHALLMAATQHAAADGMAPIAAAVDRLWDRLSSAESTAIATGFLDLDELLGGGLYAGDLLLLAARPSVGKTALALSIARKLARRGQNVLIFSLEMSQEQLAQRLAAMESGVNLSHLRRQELPEDALAQLAEAIGEVATWPITVCDLAGLTPASLRAHVMRYLAEHGETVIMIDYLQLLSGTRIENRNQEVSEISRSLKVLARDARAPILALSQLSREVEHRASKVPVLADLRDSGSLEQDADVVMFLYREELYDRDTDKKGLAELIIAKQRQGPIGVVPLRFEPQTTRFDSVSWRPTIGGSHGS
jgi:replicative DNA helicase